MAVEKSGLYYPNKMGRIYLMAMEEVMGANGIKAVLNLAKVPELIDNYPPNNLAREFDFADFGAIGQSIEEMYGPPDRPAEPIHGHHAARTFLQ